MTVIRPNSISGVTSITALTQSIEFYKSDGSLSGANIDGISINTAGIITAAHFYGNGSNLTGITQTSIVNYADNKLVTATGNVNTLNAEAGLTYDGTTLSNDAVTRNIKSGANYVLIGSSNAGGVSLGLDGDSNGDGSGTDYAFFEHDTSGNLNIVGDNPANASNIIFKTNSSTERLRLESGGTLFSKSPSDATPNFKFISDDTNWHGYLNQTVHGGTISSILSCGGTWTVDGTTYNATKDFNGSFGTAALIVHNQYNSTATGGELVFITKANGSSTTDGAVTERLRINSSGQMGLATGSSIQTNAKLQVNGNIGATQFYTTATSTPQTDFTSSVSSNKAGLLLYRSSETNGDYGGIEFHNHPSSITSYRKGGIYFLSDGSGFGRGDMIFANDMAADANNVTYNDEKLRIHREGYLTSPHQVGFYATANSGGTVSMTSTHTLTNWRLSTSGKTYSIGGHFNTSNGRFTAPVTGQYCFTSSILLAGYDQASDIHMMWQKNGGTYQYWYNTRTGNIDRSGYGGYLAQGSTTTMSLSANDYITIACNFSGTLSLWCGDANWGHFSGYLLA